MTLNDANDSTSADCDVTGSSDRQDSRDIVSLMGGEGEGELHGVTG